MAALLAHRAQQVVSLEVNEVLARTARENLQKASVYNVEVLHRDGSADLTGEHMLSGPFDVIVLSGSVAQIPETLLSMMKIGGRLSAIVGFEPMMRATLVTRVSQTAWRTTEAWDTVAPRLLGFPEPSKFTF